MMNRLVLPRITILLVVVVLIGRLYSLQLVDTEASQFRYATERRTTRYLAVRPLRGEIYASDARTLLAESVPIYTVALRPAALNQAAPPGSPERAEVFAQLGQLLGITSTLTISPAATFDADATLRSDLSQGLQPEALAQARRASFEPPFVLTVPPALAQAAIEMAERHQSVARIEPGRRRTGLASDERASGAASPPADLVPTAPVTQTLTISPTAMVRSDGTLRDDLRRLFGTGALTAADRSAPRTWVELPVTPEYSLIGLRLSTAYSASVTLRNRLAEMVDGSDIPGYQTLTLKRDIPREVAMVLRENAGSLPGMVVEQDYRRRYPLNGDIQSLSHLLGYVWRINQCELVQENPARSWIDGLLDTIGNTPQCGIVVKPISPYQLGQERYLRDDRIGKDGVEASFESELRGQLGREAIVIDAMGRPVRAPQVVQPARNGYNVVLTIDAAFQRQVEQIVKNWIAEGERRRLEQTGSNSFKRDSYLPIRAGSAVVLEIKTGRILAMVSWPAYNNNIWDPSRPADLGRFLNPPDPNARKEFERLAPLTNRAIAGLYPAGSTLKQFDALIAMQDGVIAPDTKVRDPGRLVVQDQFVAGQRYIYPNSVPRDNEWLTVSDALKVSSNVFFMSVAGGNKDRVINLKPEEQTIEKGLQIGRLAEGLGWFGFGRVTGVKLAGELSGLVPSPVWKMQEKSEQWTTGDTYNTAIGQGNLLVTPLQLTVAAAGIANNGVLYEPQIVGAITDASGRVVQELQPRPSRLPIDPQYFPVVREGMRRSVTEGLNRAARDDCSSLQIAGKTGTAEFGPNITVPPPDGKGIPRIERQTHAWFTGFAPYDDPQIQVVALFEGSGSLNDGSATIAVPAVTQIMQAYFGITPPNPLPRACPTGLPPLPQRVAPPGTLTPADLGVRER
jgi:penicillin-binding protein 2